MIKTDLQEMKIMQVAKANFKIVGFFILLFILIGHTSCDHKEIYYHFDEIKSGKWNMYDTLSFTIDSACFEINKPYNIDIEISNNINYPYQNLWLFVEDNINNNNTFSRKSEQYLITDERGKWLGSGFGMLYQSSFPFKSNIQFDEKKNYTIKVVHGMRDEVLDGIEKVGIKITPKNN